MNVLFDFALAARNHSGLEPEKIFLPSFVALTLS